MSVTSTFVINSIPSADPSTKEEIRVADGGIEVLNYPLDLLSEKSKESIKVDSVVPFVGFYIMVPSKVDVKPDDSTLDDTTTGDIIKIRGLDYAEEVNQAAAKNGMEFAKDLLKGREKIRIFRKVNILKKMICLYMPDTVNQDLQAQYNTLSIGNEVQGYGALSDAIQKGYQALFENGSIEALKSPLTNFMASFQGSGGLLGGLGTAAKFVQAGNGVAVNPLSEVFFENMSFRTYNFDFKFQPRNAKEALMVRDIIQTFRMYMVPEISKDNTAGIFFTVPAYFQPKYYIQQEGRVIENDKIPKISGCALTGVQTDWAPDGYAQHKDGMPVAVRVQLNFTELEIMHRDRIKEGY